MRLAETAVAAIAELLRENVGTDFSHGVIAVGAILPAGHDFNLTQLSAGGLLAEGDERRLIYLVPLGADADTTLADALLARLAGAGMEAIASAPRRSADDLDDAVHEAGVLLELLAEPYACLRATSRPTGCCSACCCTTRTSWRSCVSPRSRRSRATTRRTARIL